LIFYSQYVIIIFPDGKGSDKELTPKEVKRKIQKAGCYFVRSGGNHEIWKSPITNRKFQIPRHAVDIPIGTLRDIQTKSGVKLI